MATRGQDILQMFLFIVFLSIGGAALGGSILCDDLLQYYTNRRLLTSAEESLRRLTSLDADYDALRQQLRKDPNLIDRIRPAVFGTPPDDANTVYPKITPEELNAARKALMEEASPQFPEPTVPRWLVRCSKPSRRIGLFAAGAVLILISFIWFGPNERSPQQAQ